MGQPDSTTDTHLFWFSGTGNTWWATRELARHLGATRMIPLADPAAASVPPARWTGVAFPVYCWGPPAIVNRFLDTMSVEAGSYVFALMTCGADPGSTALRARQRLRRRGIELAAAFCVTLPDNYPPLGGAPPGPRQQVMFDRAPADIRRIGEMIRSGVRDHYELGRWHWRTVGRLAYPMFIKRVSGLDKGFYADLRCNGCGLCARICPVVNIELASGRPRWLGHCEQCFACLHWCPQQAIQFGRRSVRQGRYHHPACKAAELILNRPNKAASREQSPQVRAELP